MHQRFSELGLEQEMVGTQQSAIQRLAQERFGPITMDTPETYEARIRPLLLGFPNNDPTALSFLTAINSLPSRLP